MARTRSRVPRARRPSFGAMPGREGSAPRRPTRRARAAPEPGALARIPAGPSPARAAPLAAPPSGGDAAPAAAGDEPAPTEGNAPPRASAAWVPFADAISAAPAAVEAA